MQVKRSILAVATGVATAVGGMALAPAAAHAGYGGGATQDQWQVELSFNCTSPVPGICVDDQGNPSTGGFWAWAVFSAAPGQDHGSADMQLTGCGHTVGGNGGGGQQAGAGHTSLDDIVWHAGPAQPGDPTYDPDPTKNGESFYLDSYTGTFTGRDGGSFDSTSDPEFLGDFGVPFIHQSVHVGFHPAPGVAGNVTIAYRAGKTQ